MKPGDVVVGVDGGATRSRALVLDASGRERGAAEGPPGIVDPLRPEAAADVVAGVVCAALDAAGVAPPVAGLWAGLAGAGREAVRVQVEAALHTRGLARQVGVGTDAEAAHEDAFGEGAGLLVIAGTGSVALGRGENGGELRVGGWGARVGDEGSGWSVGLEALRRTLRAMDGRGPETELRTVITAALGLGSAAELAAWGEGAGKAEVAALAPPVADAASRGDPVAGQILAEAVAALADHVQALRRGLGPWREPPRVALAGGLIGGRGPLREALGSTLAGQGLTVVDAEPRGARGAAKRALRMVSP